MTSRSETQSSKWPGYERGQRLYCKHCGAELEIISPCTCEPNHLVLRCCGEAMAPSTGSAVHVNEAATE